MAPKSPPADPAGEPDQAQELELATVTLPPLPAGVPAFETAELEPSTINPKKTADKNSAARQQYFEAVVRTASRDKPTAFYGIPEDKVRGFVISLGKAVGRLKMRDIFMVGSDTNPERGDYAYIKPKRRKSGSTGEGN